jgi:hypothetical protein
MFRGTTEGEMENRMTRIALGALLTLPPFVAAQADELFRLVHTGNIACGRSLKPGKLRVATCSSYSYLFNVRTSEYFRCHASLAVTRDKKEVITALTDGNCERKPRIFEADSRYEFDAAETEPPNTNSFFGPGGFSVWAADTQQQKVRGCITIATGPDSDVSRCVDMTFK